MVCAAIFFIIMGKNITLVVVIIMVTVEVIISISIAFDLRVCVEGQNKRGLMYGKDRSILKKSKKVLVSNLNIPAEKPKKKKKMNG